MAHSAGAGGVWAICFCDADLDSTVLGRVHDDGYKVSTKQRPLQERLCANYRTVTIDWPGFGDQPRARYDWRPEIYSDFLSYLTGTVLPPVHAVIAAGHAATFALLHACAHPGSFKRLVLLAPTWRGPLPTIMDGQRPMFDRFAD